MSKRLVKVAKELNVGTASIVEFLTNNGYSIENKPTAKISSEMEAALMKEFKGSIAIKEKADQLIIGNRPAQKKEMEKEETVTTVIPTPPPTPTSQPKAPTPPPAPEVVTPKQEEIPAPVEQKEKPEVVATPEEKPVVQLKIKGKIDLDGPKKAKATPPPTPKIEEPVKEEVKEETPTKATAPVVETPVPEPKPEAKKEAPPAPPKEEKVTPPTPKPKVEGKKEQPKPVEQPKKEPKAKAEDPAKAPEKVESAPKKEAPQPVAQSKKQDKQEQTSTPEVQAEGNEAKEVEDDKVLQAKAPELRGLKILGKIDIESRSKKKKKKEPEKPAAKQDNKKGGPNKPKSEGDKKGAPNQSGSDAGQRRKRKRKKVAANTVQGNRSGGGQGGQRGGGRNQRGGGRNQRGRGGRNDEVKEVSKKEIDDKIRATMARMSGKGKKKRQRLRRENRDRLRERQEQRDQATQSDKLQLTEFISVQDLANLMDVSATQVITTCFNLGVIVSINQRLDAEIIELVADEFGHEVEFISVEESTEDEEEFVDDPEDLEPRAPIVTVMGHVDHGKTSLLDYIRNATVAEGEAGGITQHIGAYEVKVGEEQKRITFLDTPGHEAFTAMRARGAKVTDVAVIIVAADDNVMPQTKEAISHAQAADVPIVFAINKIDKPGASPERIKQELASMNLLVEEWGGDYQSQDISAKTGQNIDLLLEKILLVAELLELKANPERRSYGAILEASLDKGRGYVAKALVQSGTLAIGDMIVAGEHAGRVKAMFNEHGKRIKKAGPSAPVLVLGLSGAPQAGERFKEMESEQEAKQLANRRAQIAREQANRASKRLSLDEIGRRLALGSFKELNLIVKGDVDGSVEALSDSLIKLSIESVQVNVIHKAVGQIIESDVLLASASDGIIIGFQVRPSLGARKLAEKEGVQIKTYSIIYEAIEEIKLAIEGMLEPTKEEEIVANVEIREVFKISKVGTVAGCYVLDGKINRNSKIRVIRDGIVIYPAKEGASAELASLKRFKDDVREVKTGMECGISVKNFNDIKVGDIIEAYEIREIKAKLS